MSSELMEFEPEEHGPESQALHGRAYIDYLEGLVFRDAETIRWAGKIIDDLEVGIDCEIGDESEKISDMLLNAEQSEAELQKSIEVAFLWGLRSYVYSGNDIAPGVIHTTAILLEKDKKWLRSTLTLADSSALSQLLKEAGHENNELAEDMIYFSNRALLQLGLAPAWRRLFSRLSKS